MFGIGEIAVVLGGFLSFCGIIAYVVKITQRVSATEAKADAAATRADAAAINVAANTMRVDNISKLLSDHKETIAKEYVSQAHMASFENRLVDAITRLGDRIDSLFSRQQAPQN